MLQRVPPGNLSLKLTWIWLGLVACALVFWQLRKRWLKHFDPIDRRAKYTVRLARRLRQRRLVHLKARAARRSRNR